MSRSTTIRRASRRSTPTWSAIARLDRGAVIATAPGESSDFVIRVFAPKLGLPEDPVCGTAHRIIVPYWADRLKRSELHSRQLSRARRRPVVPARRRPRRHQRRIRDLPDRTHRAAGLTCCGCSRRRRLPEANKAPLRHGVLLSHVLGVGHWDRAVQWQRGSAAAVFARMVRRGGAFPSSRLPARALRLLKARIGS